jgi:excisionase family DNA binding protein
MRLFRTDLQEDMALEMGRTKELSEPEFLSVTAAAAILGVTGITVRRAINRGALRGYRIGRKVLIKHDEFRAWLESVRVSRAA